MTKTINSGHSTIQLFDNRQSPLGPNEKGIIIATAENRVSEWLRESLLYNMGRQHRLRYASRMNELNSLVQMAGMDVAFIEAGFFGEAMIGCLDRLRKLRPQLRIVLFTVSDMRPGDIAYYLYWSGGSYISLRGKPERLDEQLKAVLKGENVIPDDVLRKMGKYERLPAVKPHLTHQEIEIARRMAREMKIKEIACSLKISVRTANNHLRNIYRKFGIRNMVGVLKLAVTRGILPEDELRSCWFK
jgi:DNA-binding NarL/FixJ family response regulator